MDKDNKKKFNQNKDRRIGYCQSAPERVEHAILSADGEPCNDGRTGRICGNREGEKPCPI